MSENLERPGTTESASPILKDLAKPARFQRLIKWRLREQRLLDAYKRIMILFGALMRILQSPRRQSFSCRNRFHRKDLNW